MDDILRQGGDREPRRWVRRAVVAALLVLLAAAAVRHLPHDRPAAGRHGRAATAPASAPSVGAGSAATFAPPGGVPPGGVGITGHVLPWQASLRVLLTGSRPAWLWPGTGRSAPIGGLPGDRSGYAFLRVGGGWAIQLNPSAAAACGQCESSPLPVYFLADSASAAERVSMAEQVAPAAAAHALWLTGRRPGTGPRSGEVAREFSVAGTALGPQVRLPADYLIAQGTDHGLLLSPRAWPGGPRPYLLWDPATPNAPRPFRSVVAAGPHDIAWLPRCARRCAVHVLDLATGRATVARLPGASSVAAGAFSPDGRYLALQVTFSTGGGALAVRLDVLSVASGRLTAVPKTWVSSDALDGFGWPAAGDSLVAELSFTNKVQVVSWRPGASRLAVAVVRLGGQPPRLVVG